MSAQQPSAVGDDASRPARLLSLLARATAGDPILFLPISALVAVCWAALPALEYLGAPLTDTAARAVIVGAAPQAWIIDLGEWSNDVANVEVRAAARDRLTVLITALAQRPDVVVGVDVLLESHTTAEADGRLLAALSSSTNVLIGRSDRALISGFAALPSASVIIPVDAGGITRRYGPRGAVDESLAVALAKRVAPQLPLPTSAPLLVSMERAPRIVVPAASVVAQPEGFVAALPPGTAVIIGVSGESARVLHDTRTLVASPEGHDVVAGIELHARVFDDIVGGVVVVEAGLLLTLLVCLPSTAIAAGVARRIRRKHGSEVVVVVVVALLAILGLPLSIVLGSTMGALVSPFALAIAPLVAVVGPRSFGRAVRLVGLYARFSPRIRGAPPSMRRAIAEALLEPNSAARMARLLTVYEDLAHYVIVCRLALDGDKKHNGAVREGWHIQHTLATTLGVLRALAPSLAAAVQQASEIGDDLQLAARVRRAVPTLVLVDDDVKELAEVSTREKHRNWFMVLRNAVAHEGTAGFPDDTAALLSTVLERQLARIVALPDMRDILERARFDVVDGDPVLRASDREPVPLSPWLRVRHGALYRYRGLADRRDFPKHEGRLRRLVVFRAVDGGTALPEALMLPLAEILPRMPALMRIDETEKDG